MPQSDIIVRQDRTTVVEEAEISVADDASSTVDLEPDTATIRLGQGDGRDDQGFVSLPQSVTISVRAVEPRRTDDGHVVDRVYVSALSPDEGTLNDENAPWGSTSRWRWTAPRPG